MVLNAIVKFSQNSNGVIIKSKNIRSQSNENDKTGIFDRFFFNYKFLYVKIVANTNKNLVRAY